MSEFRLKEWHEEFLEWQERMLEIQQFWEEETYIKIWFKTDG